MFERVIVALVLSGGAWFDRPYEASALATGMLTIGYLGEWWRRASKRGMHLNQREERRNASR